MADQVPDTLDSEVLLNAVLDALPDAVITITEEGLIASYSQAAEQMLGYKAREVFGQNIKMLMPAPYRDEHDGYLERYKNTDEKKVIGLGRDVQAQRKDGTVFPIHLSVSEMFVQGRRMFTGIIRDQSRLKRAEKKTEQFAQIIESVSNEVHIVDAETFEVLHSNLAARLNLGYTSGEVLGLKPWDMVQGIDQDNIEAFVGPLRGNSNDLRKFEETRIRKDGSTYRALTQIRWLDVDDRPVFVAVVQDLTELKAARSKGAQFGEILESSLNEIYMFDADSLKFAMVNLGARQNLGYSFEEFKELTPVDIKPEMTLERFERIVAPLRSGKVKFLNFSTKHQRKDGSIYPVEVNLQLAEIDDQSLFVAIIQDVTEQTKLNEELLLRDRAMAEVVSGILITDAKIGENLIVYANAAMKEMTGYSSEEMIGRHPSFLHGSDQNQAALDDIYTAIAEFQPVRGIIRNYRKDGSLFMNEITISPVSDDAGTVTHFISVQTDVTSKLEMEDRLRQSQKMDAIGQLTGGIAHNFNNMLTVVIGNNELLAGRLSGDDIATTLLSDASSAAENGAKLTDQLLSFARRQPLDPKPIDLNELVYDLGDMLGRTLGATITLNIKLEEGLGLSFADRAQVQNALLNLAINARDAMPNGGVLTIETSVAYFDADDAVKRGEILAGRYTCLSVRDTGTGISPEILPRVLEPFFTTKEVGKGTGLGLSMVHGFAKQSGGHLEIDSEPDFGTSISLYLPDAAGLDNGDLNNCNGVSLVEKGAEKILVVEDNARVRKTTINRLTYLGYETLQAESGQQALDILAGNSNVDLVFTDMIMPGGMSGADLLDEARKLYPQIKFIISSGYSDQSAKPSDGTLWLPKPYKLEEMSQLLRQLLD